MKIPILVKEKNALLIIEALSATLLLNSELSILIQVGIVLFYRKFISLYLVDEVSER